VDRDSLQLGLDELQVDVLGKQFLARYGDLRRRVRGKGLHGAAILFAAALAMKGSKQMVVLGDHGLQVAGTPHAWLRTLPLVGGAEAVDRRKASSSSSASASLSCGIANTRSCMWEPSVLDLFAGRPAH
jgi:hypothetical protein